MENIEIGNMCSGYAIGLKKRVTGRVEQIYTNTILLNVLEYDYCDKLQLIEYHYKVLVKNEDIIQPANEMQSLQIAT